MSEQDVYELLYGSKLVRGKMAMQDDLWGCEAPLEGLLDRAVELVVIASQPENADDPLRQCVHEDLLLVHQMMDPVRYGPKVSSVSEELIAGLPGGQCRYCMGTLVSQGLLAQGQAEEAARRAKEYLSELGHTGASWEFQRRLDLMCVLAETAHVRGDREELARYVELLRAGRPELKDEDNASCEAWTVEQDVRLADLDDDPRSALAGYREVVRLVGQGHWFALRSAVVLARLRARLGDAEGALALADENRVHARRRNAHRLELTSLELTMAACEALGREEERSQRQSECEKLRAQLAQQS